MAICGVVTSESLLTYDPVHSGGIPRSAWHLTIPEQAPPPPYSDTFLGIWCAAIVAGIPAGVHPDPSAGLHVELGPDDGVIGGAGGAARGEVHVRLCAAPSQRRGCHDVVDPPDRK